MNALSNRSRNSRRTKSYDQNRIEIVRSEVVSNHPSDVVLDVTFHLLTCFVNEAGKDVTTGPRALEQHSTWSLKIQDDRWLLHQGTLEEDRTVKDQDEGC